jgi:hypothetical protein
MRSVVARPILLASRSAWQLRCGSLAAPGSSVTALSQRLAAPLRLSRSAWQLRCGSLAAPGSSVAALSQRLAALLRLSRLLLCLSAWGMIGCHIQKCARLLPCCVSFERFV